MDSDKLFRLFDDLIQDDLIFGYSGAFSDAITEMIIEISEQNIESHGNLIKLKKKISFLMAECYQNIVRHGTNPYANLKFPAKASAFFCRSRNGVFYITSANYVLNEFKDIIGGKLDRVNDLSQDELKELSREILQKGELSEKGGAGLGIIEMARKSGNKLDYLFEKINDKLSMFYLHLRLRSENEAGGEEKNVEINIEEMKQMHDMLNSENVLIMHKGDFSRVSVLPVIQMIEGNLKDQFDTPAEKQRLYHISVEILQNISKHGYKKNSESEGMFILGKQNGHFIINTVNIVEKANAGTLNKYLNELTKMSREELDSKYKSLLRTGPGEESKSAGLGLIDVFRACHSYNYEMIEEDEVYKFSQIIVI
jgi:hypothetical protein